MGKRFKKALQALGLVLLITFACLAFMPWRMSDAIGTLDEVDRCMILRYDQSYSTAYPQDEQLEALVSALQSASGHFDRNRSSINYQGKEPLYRIYFWNGEGRIPEVWLCETAIFYDGSQFVLMETDAEALNTALASCFS